MGFRKPKPQPQFADLVGILAQSGSPDNALYQTVQEIINRLDQLFTSPVGVIQQIQQGQGPGGGGTGGPHHGTHEPGGTDYLVNSVWANVANTFFTNQTIIGELTANGLDGTPLNASNATSGTLPDARLSINVLKHPGGYPGDTTNFLRADGTFAPVTAPPPTLTQSFLTFNAEPSLPGSRRLVAGSNITLIATSPGEVTISATGGAGGGMNLDYLGDYVGGPIYNDGDIVIGSDGVTYMCVVDGTITPPEPWPGGGIATSDGTYWTVTPHAGLANERALNTLANGYVKSTAGEPSTVAIIPVNEGGTGANNAGSARTNLGVGNVGTFNTNGNPVTYLDGTGNWTTPTGTGIPSGALILMTVPCPPGYTRASFWDGYYVRMGPAVAAGGSNTHQHGPGTYVAAAHQHGVGTYASQNHTHAAGSLNVPAHNHGGSVSVTISGSTGGGGGHDHTFSGTTGGESAGAMNVDGGASGNMTRSPHTHNFSGTTSNQADHTHGVSGSGSGTIGTQAATGLTGSVQSDGGGVITGLSGSIGAAITGLSDAQSNMPAYVDFFACVKD